MDYLNYIEQVNNTLKPKNTHNTLVLDLFAGCGGLALGFEAQGFITYGFEMNSDCCKTYNENLSGKCKEIFITPDTEFPSARVVIGGPPCQPFSVGGLQKGIKDKRNGFPAFISAIKKVKPDIWLFENVRGLLYKNKGYLDQVISDLEELGYMIEYRLLNAVNFLVPQNRERVIVVGHKGGFHFPRPAIRKITAGEALGELAFQAPLESRFLNESMDKYIAKYEKASKCINPRDLRVNQPARTLTCRNLAGATGDMQRVKLPDGRRRRLLEREAARLQSFPDWYNFSGTADSVFNQIGNAVPPYFAYHLASSIKEYLDTMDKYGERNIQIEKQLSFTDVYGG